MRCNTKKYYFISTSMPFNVRWNKNKTKKSAKPLLAIGICFMKIYLYTVVGQYVGCKSLNLILPFFSSVCYFLCSFLTHLCTMHTPKSSVSCMTVSLLSSLIISTAVYYSFNFAHWVFCATTVVTWFNFFIFPITFYLAFLFFFLCVAD